MNSSITTVRPAAPNSPRSMHCAMAASASSRVAAHDRALPGGEAIRLHDAAARRAPGNSARAPRRRRTSEARGRNAVARHQLLRECLGALDARGRRARPEYRRRRPRERSASPATSGTSGPTTARSIRSRSGEARRGRRARPRRSARTSACARDARDCRARRYSAVERAGSARAPTPARARGRRRRQEDPHVRPVLRGLDELEVRAGDPRPRAARRRARRSAASARAPSSPRPARESAPARLKCASA